MKVIWVCIAVLVTVGQANAMLIKTSGDQMVLGGPVLDGDTPIIADALAKNPKVTTIILRNSPGGDVLTGYQVGEMIREKGLRTAVSGYCFSSCSRMFLGGRIRIFTDDYSLANTHVGFHGHYNNYGLLNVEAVKRYHLKDWIIKYSDGKADPELVERWINIPEAHDMVHFYHPTLPGHEATTFFCHADEPTVFSCEAIYKSALDLGVITSLDIIHSNDLMEYKRLAQ
jgi:hypothetical protein